jgi:usherin
VSWTSPLGPNGDITSYSIFLDSEEVFSSTSVGSFVATDLLPNQEYIAQLRVCTLAGCSSSAPVSAMTFESRESLRFCFVAVVEFAHHVRYVIHIG